MKLFGKLFDPAPVPPSDAYVGLRMQALGATRDQLGLLPDPAAPIHGVIMETGAKDGVSTFVCLADGTVSLYTSRGGGVIGAGAHEEVRSALTEMLALTNKYAADYIAACKATSEYPLPERGQVFFYLLASSGVYLARCDERALEEQRDPMAALFGNVHVVMGEARMAEERKRGRR